jgi:DNA replication and repair protein RecF
LADRYYLTRLALTEFRNHEFLSAEFGDGPVVITGPNGAGKTNILEAVSLLAPGRGLRGATLAEMRRVSGAGEARSWGAAAVVMSDEGGGVRIGTGGKDDPASPGRRMHVDGKNVAKQADLLEHVRLLWYAPAMQHRLSGGASERRRWLDRLAAVYDPAHERRLHGYEYYLRERMKLLTGPKAADPAWLSSLEREAAARSVALSARRVETALSLSRHMREHVSCFPQAELRAAGETESRIEAGEEAGALAEDLRERLARGRGADARTGRTCAGAHKGDFVVRYKQKDVGFEYCSTGEQKALLLSVLLAHMRAVTASAGVTPILLLDEAFSQLDEGRRHRLCEELLALRAQFWLTGTDREAFGMLEGTGIYLALDLKQG